MSADIKWFEDWDNIAATARYLVHEKYCEAEEVLALVEKPWKFEDEYQAACAHAEGLLCVECEEKRGEKRAEADGRVLCEKCLQTMVEDAEDEDEYARVMAAEGPR